MLSSRKRNKGKERKAKKAAEEAKIHRETVYSLWSGWAKGVRFDKGKVFTQCHELITQCDHGCVAVPDGSHPVSVFLTEFYITCGNMRNTLINHEEVQNSDVHRKLALDIFTRIGVNWILRGEEYNMIIECATNILLLESYDKTGADYDVAINRRVTAQKLRDFLPLSHKRDVLKFFRKRITCSCLKKMHLEARKTMPKMGVCWHCKHVRERTLLMVCSRCMVAHYCSRECQIAALSEHRSGCDKYVRAHEHTVANTTT